jgi:O-antigen/teichoic acid export membrane protein
VTAAKRAQLARDGARSGTMSAFSEGRIPARAVDGGVRRHAARGMVINAVFQVGMAALGLGRRVVVAAFLTTAEFGLWGLLMVTLMTVLFVKNAGIGDRYVQQAEDDQEAAFQKAFTVDLLLGVLATALAAIALPIFAAAYGRSQIIVPGLVLSLAIIGNSLQSPTWIYYRGMNFRRQRSLQAIDPCIAFVLTVALAVLGAGYWALIAGAVVGSFAGAAVALKTCPYRIRFRLEGGTARDYFSFSWPLVVASGGGIAIGLLSVLIASRTLGLAAVGAIGLAVSINAFADGVDGIVTQTLYPAICAIRDRTDLLFETFIKSNRLALMWGMPFGVCVALFAPDLVHYALGSRWELAIPVIQAFGLVAAFDQLGFNWTAFLRAVNWTRPLATIALLNIATFLAITAPLLITHGLRGFAVGWIAAQLVTLAARTYFLTRLFAGFKILRHAARAMAPVIPATAVVLLARWAEPGHRTAASATTELIAFWAAVVVLTVLLERALLREALGYLMRRRTRGVGEPATA